MRSSSADMMKGVGGGGLFVRGETEGGGCCSLIAVALLRESRL